MPQMMPIWWVLLFLVVMFTLMSSVAVLFSFLVTPLQEFSFKSSEESSWWMK